MPITNGKYVAPTWSNGGGTPLSAANLQDMSDALAFSGRIATGTYRGTNTYGSSNPNSLSFDFTPKILIVSQDNDSTIAFFWNGWAINNGEGILLGYADGMFNFGGVTWGKTITWYSTQSAWHQLNRSNVDYNYLAIG